MFFVQSLRQSKGVFRRETKARIRFALQAGQIKQRWRHLRRGFGLLTHDARLAFARHDDGVGSGFTPQTIVFALGVAQIFFGVFVKFWIEPTPSVDALRGDKFSVHFPIIARYEFANRFFALNHHGQGRRLHTANGGEEKPAIA